MAPQWSPSGSDGMTRKALQRLSARGLAAMEPVRIGRDDAAIFADQRREFEPQWSPSGSDGMTLVEIVILVVTHLPQWSPSGSDGMTVPLGRVMIRATLPQWSPSGSDGMTGSSPGVSTRPGCRNGARPDRTG